jgi:two-component system, NtrC family, response regulator AlgB
MSVHRVCNVMDIQRTINTSEVECPPSAQTTKEVVEEAAFLDSQNPRMKALLETVKRAAAADTTILLTGESGTGKDVLARQIHRWSSRSSGPFVVINCATLPEQLLENDLFGHVRGAFTGALNDKPGRLEAGHTGTVFFDEIADIPVTLQTKFLRFIQERSFERVGSSHTLTVNVRLLAASKRNLEAEMAAGRFREDLYYRLNVITVVLPPLRERTEDILALANCIMRQVSVAVNSPGLSISPEAAEMLLHYHWPGNLRELHNALEHAATLTRTPTIMIADLPDTVRNSDSGISLTSARRTRLKDFEREHILRVMAETPTLGQAAATLGINVTTLWRKRRHYGIA